MSSQAAVIEFLDLTAREVKQSSAPSIQEIASKMELSLVFVKLTPYMSNVSAKNFWSHIKTPSQTVYDIAIHIYTATTVDGAVYVITGTRITNSPRIYHEPQKYAWSLHAAHSIDNFAAAIPPDKNDVYIPSHIQLYRLFDDENRNRSSEIRRINATRSNTAAANVAQHVDEASSSIPQT